MDEPRDPLACLDVGLCAQVACVWEVCAAKPGNVDCRHCFADVTHLDFLLSAAAVAPVLRRAAQQGVGQTVLDGVGATRRVVRTNTNLGILLLLAPLAAVAPGEKLRAGLPRVLARLDVLDSRRVYEAIRLAVPGGLGQVEEQDVAAEPTRPLLEIMELAAGRDGVARQYANGFRDVFDEGVPALARGLERFASVEEAIVGCHLRLLARFPDTLIARKRGLAEAEDASRRAGNVLAAGWPGTVGRRQLADLDAWLRAEGNARNPGTTADLVTASLFVALREGTIALPPRLPWSAAERT